MKKQMFSLLLAVVVCLTAVQAAGAEDYTMTVGGIKMTFTNAEDMKRIIVDEDAKTIRSMHYSPPTYFPVTLTMDGNSGPCPYRFNTLGQTEMTIDGISVAPDPDIAEIGMGFAGKTLEVKGKNTFRAERSYVTLGEMDLTGSGSIEVESAGMCLYGVHMLSGNLYSTTKDFSNPYGGSTAYYMDYGGLVMDGGSLTAKQGDYLVNGEDEDMFQRPSGPIQLADNMVINGGRVLVEPGTDLRTGIKMDCITAWDGYGAVIRGGIFNIGDVDANTVLGVKVEQGCQVVANPDPETSATYPYKVQKVEEPLIFYPRNVISHPEKTIQFNAAGTAAQNVSWSVSGQNMPGTGISETGLLTVVADETSKSLTVTASAGAYTDQTTVSLETEVFDIWLIVQEWYGSGYTVLEHKQLKKGETFVLPTVDNIPGMKHVGWYDYDRKSYELGAQSPPATQDEIYWTKLEETADSFMVGGELFDMPAVGGRVNSAGGTTAEGTWWVERPREDAVEFTMNGVDLQKETVPAYGSVEAQIAIPSTQSLTVHVRGDNRLVTPAVNADSFHDASGFYQPIEKTGGTVTFDFEPNSTLTIEDRKGQSSQLLNVSLYNVTLKGSGKMKIHALGEQSEFLYSHEPIMHVTESAQLELNTEKGTSQVGYAIPDTQLSGQASLLMKGDGVPFIPTSDGDSYLKMEEGFHIVGSIYPDGRNPQSLTRTEYLERMEAYPYAKISKEPAPPHEENYGLWLGGVQATAKNRNDILGNGRAAYDPSTNTLTLKSATITASGSGSHVLSSGLYYAGKTLHIVNSGNSTISGGPGDDSSGMTLIDTGLLHVEGSGSLSAIGRAQSANSFGVDWRPSSLCKLHMTGEVVLEMQGATASCRYKGSIDLQQDTKMLCSESPDGSDLQESSGLIREKPFALAYQPIPVDMEILHENKYGPEDHRGTVDFRGVRYMKLLAAATDQLGRPLEIKKDHLRWEFSEKESSTNAKKHFGNLTLYEDGLVEQWSMINEACYIGVEVTHIPSGRKKGSPVLLIGDGPLQKLSVAPRPGYENKVYREGEDFDPNSIILTRVYPTFSAESRVVRHPDVFTISDFQVYEGKNLTEGQKSVIIVHAYEEEGARKEMEVHVPIVVQSGAGMAAVPDGLRVTSPTAATLMIAAYDNNGRMTGVKTYAIAAGTTDKQFDFAAGEKAFLLDSAFEPLCPTVHQT